MNLMNFFAELKRRNVYKVAVAYAVVGWLLIQVATAVFPFLGISNAAVWLVVVVVIVGFPIALVIAWAFEMTPEGMKRTQNISPNERLPQWSRRKFAVFIAGTAAVAASLLAFQLLLPKPAAVQTPTSTPRQATAIPEKSIAVLPFENLGDDKKDVYFVSGMRDDILTSLAQLPDLNVRSRTSSGKYQSHSEDLRALSRELDVTNVLEGSVQKRGDDVLINVQLVDARSGKQLWGHSYRHNVQDMLGVQGEVAQKIADALRIKLAPAQEHRLLVPPTTNVRAHDLFLRGHALGLHSDEQSLEGKIALLNEAVAEDPHYAMAWGDLAGAYLTIADAYRAPRQVLLPMRHAAMMAVRNDDDAGVGHIWLGAVSMLYDRNFPLAKRELERAVALNPNSADAHRWLGWYLARVERNFDAGRAELQRARVLDPVYTWPLMFECFIDIASGEYQSAMRLAEQVMEIDPHFFYDVDPIASVYCGEGRWQDAVQRYESLPADLFTRPNFQLAICYVHVGQSDRARKILADLETLSQRKYVDQMHIAAIYAALGEKDKAFAALDRACDDRSARVSTPRFYTWLSPLFDDPRFAALEYKVAHSALSSPND